MANILAGRRGAGQTRADLFYKPNLDLVNQALAARQQRYDTNYTMLDKFGAKMDEANALEADKERWFQIKDEYDNRINDVMKSNRGDLSKSGAMIKSLKSDIGDLFGIHGEATAIDSNYMAAMKNRQELKKRREEGKITEGQYRQWDIGISEYKGVGKDSKNWNSWQSVNATDAVDPDDFLKEHIKLYEHDIENSGYKKIRQENGHIFYQNEAGNIIKYDEVYNNSVKALKTKMEETGQLQSDYKWDMFSTGKKPDITNYISEYSGQANELRQHATAFNTNDINALKQAIGKFDDDLAGQLEGAKKEDIYKVRDKLLEEINGGLTSLDERINELGDLNEDEVSNYHYGRYATETVGDLVKPYAQARSRQQMSLDLKIIDDVTFKHKLDLEKERLRYSHERMLIDYKFQVENPRMDVRTKGQALSFERPGGVNTQDGNSEIDKNNQQIVQTQDGILQNLYDKTYGSNNPKAPSFGQFKKSFFQENGFTPDEFKNAKAENINGKTYISVIGPDGNAKRVEVSGIAPETLNREFNTIRSIDRKNNLINQRKNNSTNTALHDLKNEGVITDNDVNMYQNINNVTPEQREKIKQAYAVYDQNFDNQAGGGIWGMTIGNVQAAMDWTGNKGFQGPRQAFREKLSEEEFSDMLLNQYDNSYGVSPIPGKSYTKKRNDHLEVLENAAPNLYNDLHNDIIAPRLNFENKIAVIQDRAEKIYGNVPEDITISPDLYNIDVLLGDLGAQELATAKKSWDQYVSGDRAKADLANTQVMVAGQDGFKTMDEILRENGAEDYTIGNSFWTGSPLVNDGITSVFNILMEIPVEVGGTKTTQLVSKQIHVPTSELSANFIEDYAQSNQIRASRDYVDAIKSGLSEYGIDLGNFDGANYRGTIYVGGDDNQTPKQRRNNSYGMISIEDFDIDNYEGLVNKNDINKMLPYDQYEKLRVDLENYSEYELQAKNRFPHVNNRQLNGLYTLSNNSNLTPNEIIDFAVEKGGFDVLTARALLDITPTGKKRAIISTTEPWNNDNYSVSYSRSKTTN